MAKITKNDEGKVVSLADEEELRALDNPVLIDVRGEDEIEKRVTAPGAINVVWNRDEGNFYDPSKLLRTRTPPSCSTEAAAGAPAKPRRSWSLKVTPTSTTVEVPSA